MEILANLVNSLDVWTEFILENLGIWGALISCLLITVESILPFLPLCVFITLEFYTFGNIIGFFISWIFTCLGCFLSFTLCRNKIKNWSDNKIKKMKNAEKIFQYQKYIDKMSLSSLTVLIAIPFTPASFVNVAAGLSNMTRKKYMTAVLIGKIFMVYFWGYIGTSLVECITHPIYLVKICIMLLIAFVVSKVINKKYNME